MTITRRLLLTTAGCVLFAGTASAQFACNGPGPSSGTVRSQTTLLGDFSDTAPAGIGRFTLRDFVCSIPNLAPASTGVTSVATGTGLVGGTITSTGTIALATVPTLNMLANIGGGTTAPAPTTLGAYANAVSGGGTVNFLRADGTFAIPALGGTATTEITTIASATGGSGFRIPQGVAPTSPVNGDIWTTSAGLWVRANGITTGPLAQATGLGFTPVNVAGDTMLGELTFKASAAGASGVNYPQGAAPTSPVNGDVWITSTGIFVRINGVTVGPLIASNQTNNFTATQSNQPAVIPDGTPIVPDFSKGNLYKMTLLGNRNLGNPINLVTGMSFCIEFTNGGPAGVAGITSWGSVYTSPGGSATLPLFTQVVGAVDEICGRSYDGVTIRITEANNFSH